MEVWVVVAVVVRMWVPMVVLRAGAPAGLGAMFPSRGLAAFLALLIAASFALSVALRNWDRFRTRKCNDFKVHSIRGVNLRKRGSAQVVVCANFVVPNSANRDVVSV